MFELKKVLNDYKYFDIKITLMKKIKNKFDRKEKDILKNSPLT